MKDAHYYGYSSYWVLYWQHSATWILFSTFFLATNAYSTAHTQKTGSMWMNWLQNYEKSIEIIIETQHAYFFILWILCTGYDILFPLFPLLHHFVTIMTIAAAFSYGWRMNVVYAFSFLSHLMRTSFGNKMKVFLKQVEQQFRHGNWSTSN